MPQSPAPPADSAEPPRPTAPPRTRISLIVGAAVLVLALVGVGVMAIAVTRAGAATPTEAVTKLARALGGTDALAVINALPPNEAKLLTDVVATAVPELQRLEVLAPDADPERVEGLDVTVEEPRFDAAGTEEINEHLAITKLTGGRITLNYDLRRVPLVDRLVRGLTGGETGTATLDITRIVDRTGEPVRIAAVKVGGGWYASLFYTIADTSLAAADRRWPATPVPARGEASPEDAVGVFVGAALESDVRRLIELLPPEEMAVLHDAGPALVSAAAGNEPSGVRVLELETDSTRVSGGVQLRLRSIVLDNHGSRTEAHLDGGCLAVRSDDSSGVSRICPAEFKERLLSYGFSLNALSGYVLTSGVVVVEAEGGWHVSPARTSVELLRAVLASLEPRDVERIVGGR